MKWSDATWEAIHELADWPGLLPPSGQVVFNAPELNPTRKKGHPTELLHRPTGLKFGLALPERLPVLLLKAINGLRQHPVNLRRQAAARSPIDGVSDPIYRLRSEVE